MRYKAPMNVVQAAADGAQCFSVVHDDLDLDLAQAHMDAGIEELLADPDAFAAAVKGAGGHEGIARSVIHAFFSLPLPTRSVA